MKRRTGFTLVELLVAMALIALIMAVLSQTIVLALEGIGEMRAMGNLQENLRVGTVPMRRDLLSRHFGSDEKISTLTAPPSAGFFQIIQRGDAILEGTDADGLPSYRTTTCELHFTVRGMPSGASQQEDYYLGIVPQDPAAPNPPTPAKVLSPTAFQQNGVALGNAVEVYYFLRPILTETAGNVPGGLQLYSLHRRQKIVHGRATELNTTYAGQHGDFNRYGDFACGSIANPTPSGLGPQFRTLADLVVQANRTVTAVPTGMSGDNTQLGDDLLMSDVLSFDVQVLPQDSFFTTRPDLPFGYVHVKELYRNLTTGAYPAAPWEYDTASTNSNFVDSSGNIIPAKYNLKGIKITIRVWDFKKNLTRQITIIEEM